MDCKPQLSIGQHLAWAFVDENTTGGQARVKAVRTDPGEALSPEAQEYAALWIEVEGTSGTRNGEAYTVMLGTDLKSYIDGREITVSMPS